MVCSVAWLKLVDGHRLIFSDSWCWVQVVLRRDAICIPGVLSSVEDGIGLSYPIGFACKDTSVIASLLILHNIQPGRRVCTLWGDVDYTHSMSVKHHGHKKPLEKKI